MSRTNVIGIIVIAAMAVAIWILFNRLQRSDRLNDNYQSVIAEQTDSIRYERTVSGRERAEKLAAQATAKQFKEAYPQFAERVVKEFDVKLKDMKVFIENKFTAHGSGEGTVVNNVYGPDGYLRKEAEFGDAYLRATVSFLDTSRFSWTYNYSDTISTVVHTEKKWFLGKEKLYVKSILQNKNAKITGATSVLIDSYRDKRFVIYVGVGYDPFNNRPSVNAGIGYALFKF